MSPLFVPGPVDVDPEVLSAQSQAMLPHRSQEFESIYRRARENARQLFDTESRVFVVTCSGTGLQEAAIRNLAKQDVLSCVNGAFSQRWYEVAKTNGKQADRLEVEWGQPITPQIVAEALKRKEYDLITLVHNETSTGVQNPIQEIAALVRRASPNTLISLDAVSSLGGIKIEMDAWGLDMVLASSQKCLALPPGLALAAVSDRALACAQKVPERGWYFDLVRMETHLNKDSTPATPAISLIYALDMQLDRIINEGLENRFSRHSAMAGQVQDWVLANGFEIFAQEGYRSQTVTTISNTLSLDIAELNTFLMSKGMQIADGYGKLRGSTFRIAHMGETQIEDINNLLTALDEFIA
ncbi:MAG: alanine--glyoxylate aminotransferase family protein [Anaerolineales bacterium]